MPLPILKLWQPGSFGPMPSATADCITTRWTSALATRRASSWAKSGSYTCAPENRSRAHPS
eukprot:6231902-Pyramimonas_sp.AAC.1